MKLSEAQDRLEFYKTIKKNETKLYDPEIEDIFGSEDNAQKNEFKIRRSKYSLYILKIENNILSVLVDKLEELKDDFQSGITNLESKIAAADDAVGILQILGQVLGIIGTIVKL
jgi:hypothetical protein